MSVRTVTRIFHRQNLVLVRPRPRPAKGIQETQQEFFDNLRNTMQQATSNDHYLFFDACSLKHSATITRMWCEKGTQPEVIQIGGRARKHVLGILDWTADRALFSFNDTLKAKEFIQFLKALLREYSSERLHVVLDNARAHHAIIVQEFVITKGDRLELIFLPPYSPNLNPIEKFWAFLRKEVTHNTFFPTFDVFEGEVAEFLCGFKTPNQKVHSICDAYHTARPILVSDL